MARGVLGNDPFKRGAALRTADAEAAEQKPAEPAKAAAPAPVAKKATKPKTLKKATKGTVSKPTKKRAPQRKVQPAVEVVAPEETAPETPVHEEVPLAEAPGYVPVEEEREPEHAHVHHATPEREAEPASPHLPAREQLIEAEVEAVAPDESAPDLPTEEEIPHREPSSVTGHSLRDRAAGAMVLGRDLLAHAAESGALSNALETASGLFRALQTGLGTAGAANLDEYGKDPSLANQLRGFSSFFYDRYWRVNVEGAHNVPSGPSILVANHSGAMPFDGPVLHAALTRERGDLPEARWLVEDQVFHAPFLGVLLNRLGAVRACPENAIRLLEEGRPVIVFPEGLQGISKAYRERYRLMRFGRGGFVKLALKMKVPIVPVAIVGAEESMPMLARLPGKMFGVPYLPLTSPVPLPARWTIRFGEPIDVSDQPASAADDLVLVHQLTDKTRESVQGMVDALLKSRRSVF